MLLNLPWKGKPRQSTLRGQVHIPGPLLLAAEPTHPDEAKMRLARAGTDMHGQALVLFLGDASCDTAARLARQW